MVPVRWLSNRLRTGLWLARRSLNKGEFEKAIPLFTKVIELDDSNPSFFANRGSFDVICDR
ncbi:MAG: hypothetical protein CMO55_25015 [Verrucomicrobiales bacterium]|nr:hypothetical protein [Verrucomicrobiales bacterium]